MGKTRPLALAFALAACGNQHSTPRAEQVTEKATPVDPAPSLAAVFDAATIPMRPNLDATALGDVTVYLAYRVGGLAFGARQVEPSLLLVGDSALRVQLTNFLVVDSGQPFGAIVTSAPHDPEPPLPPTGDVVATLTAHHPDGITHQGLMATREGDTLAIWSAFEILGEVEPDHWFRLGTITLAPGAAAATGQAPLTGAPLGHTIEVEIREEIAPEVVIRDDHDARPHDVALRVGDRAGPIALEWVEHSDDEHWRTTARYTDLPGAAVALASRRYGRAELVIARAGDDVVVWRREWSPAWVELARVPLAPGATLELLPLPRP